MACLSPSIFVVSVKSQKVGRRVVHYLSKRDRCGQKVSLVSAVRGDFFKPQTFQYW